MKRQTTKAILIKIFTFSGMLLAGSVIGITAAWQYALHDGASGKGVKEADSLITDKIAIVNLDEGVTIQDEKVNYAEKLIIDLDENFLFTGLEDARQGYATGIYAGYIIVPATFSESVVSLNDTPIRAEISYAINDSLREDIKEEVIYDVLTLMSDMNDNISYMYLHSVLDDFHTAQDEAGTVMNNDLKEKEAIEAVQANDLVALVPVTEFTVVENTIEPVDISEYMVQNMEFTSQIGLKYAEYLMASETDHMKINEEALLLMAEMNNMSDIIGDNNFSQNEDSASLYQEGMEALDALLEEYNIALGEKEMEIDENVLGIYGDINLYLTAYDRAMAAYLAGNAASHDNILKAVEELFVEYQNQYTLVPVEEMQLMEDTLEAQNAALMEQQTLILELQENGGENGGDAYMDDTLQRFTPETGAGPGADTGADTEIEAWNELQDKILQEFNIDCFVFGGCLLDEEGEMVLDEDGNTILLTSLLEEYRKNLEDPFVEAKILEEEVGVLEKVDSGVLHTCINEKILMPIQENVNSFTEAVMAQYEIEQEQLLTYNEAIMEYDPASYIDHEELQTLTNDMLDNGTNLSEAVLETDVQQMEYVADVYEATREDLFTLQDNIVQAKEDSDKAVEEGLQALKDTKDENSAVNQQILYDFSTKLPYTRLGSLEYVQAYEFMANPVSAVNSNAEGKSRSTRADSVRTESDSVNVQAKRRVDYQNISFMICMVICVIIVAATIKYHFHKKEESYETE